MARRSPAAPIPEHLERTRTALRAQPAVRDDLEGALQPARAALWLLDQIRTGELCFLRDKDRVPPCWTSAPACEAMDIAALRDWLEDLAVTGIARGLAELVLLIQPQSDVDDQVVPMRPRKEA